MTDQPLSQDDASPAADYLGDFTVVARLNAVNEALALKGCLQAAGVPASIGDQNLMMQGGSWLGGVASGVRVLVPATLVPRATEIIVEYRSGALAIEGDEDPALPPPITATTLPLWSPDLAAWLSLALTPIFGATLHWMNSRALREPALQRSAKAWLALSIVATGAGFWLLHEQDWTVRTPLRVSGVLSVYTLLWYLLGAHAQSRFIARSFGIRYPHRPMALACAVAIALLLAVGFAGSALASD